MEFLIHTSLWLAVIGVALFITSDVLAIIEQHKKETRS